MDSGDDGKKYIDIRPYSIGELAKMYGVCTITFHKWIIPFENEIGEKIGRYYSISQVRTIFKHLLLPSKVENDTELE